MSQLEQYMSTMYGVRVNAKLINGLGYDIVENVFITDQSEYIPSQLERLEFQLKSMELYIEQMKREIALAKDRL